MKGKLLFKVLFAVLTVIFVAGGVLLAMNIYATLAYADVYSIYINLMIAVLPILALGLLGGIGIYVYKDASKRGLDPWMWMTLSMFIPNFLGLIIYLIVRNNISNERLQCFNCNKEIDEKFKICPYCATPLDRYCHRCGGKVNPKWKVCPHCSSEIMKDEVSVEKDGR